MQDKYRINIPRLNVLSQAKIEQLHQASLTSRTGFQRLIIPELP